MGEIEATCIGLGSPQAQEGENPSTEIEVTGDRRAQRQNIARDLLPRSKSWYPFVRIASSPWWSPHPKRLPRAHTDTGDVTARGAVNDEAREHLDSVHGDMNVSSRCAA